jgi:hypothetical protein
MSKFNSNGAVTLGRDSIGSAVDEFELIRPEPSTIVDNSPTVRIGRVSQSINRLRRDVMAINRIRSEYGLIGHRQELYAIQDRIEEETLDKLKSLLA